MASAAHAATPTARRSCRSVKTPTSLWPRNRPPCTLPVRETHRHREVAAHRQMPGRHAVVRRIVAEARIRGDVGQPHDAGSGERRTENRGVARHREARERFPRRAGQRVQHVGFAGGVRRRCRRTRRSSAPVSAVASSVTVCTTFSGSSSAATAVPMRCSVSAIRCSSRARAGEQAPASPGSRRR